VKKFLQSVYIYGSYRKIKTGVPFFWTTRYIFLVSSHNCLRSHDIAFVILLELFVLLYLVLSLFCVNLVY